MSVAGALVVCNEGILTAKTFCLAYWSACTDRNSTSAFAMNEVCVLYLNAVLVFCHECEVKHALFVLYSHILACHEIHMRTSFNIHSR